MKANWQLNNRFDRAPQSHAVGKQGRSAPEHMTDDWGDLIADWDSSEGPIKFMNLQVGSSTWRLLTPKRKLSSVPRLMSIMNRSEK
jgi:hypothetical protein